MFFSPLKRRDGLVDLVLKVLDLLRLRPGLLELLDGRPDRACPAVEPLVIFLYCVLDLGLDGVGFRGADADLAPHVLISGSTACSAPCSSVLIFSVAWPSRASATEPFE